MPSATSISSPRPAAIATTRRRLPSRAPTKAIGPRTPNRSGPHRLPEFAQFIIWLAGSVAYLINQGIGCIQIMRINNRRLHPEFHVGKINLVLLPLATVTRWASVGIWLYAGGLAKIIRRWQAGG